MAEQFAGKSRVEQTHDWLTGECGMDQQRIWSKGRCRIASGVVKREPQQREFDPWPARFGPRPAIDEPQSTRWPVEYHAPELTQRLGTKDRHVPWLHDIRRNRQGRPTKPYSDLARSTSMNRAQIGTEFDLLLSKSRPSTKLWRRGFRNHKALH
jgi:hypothetical protein